MASSQISPENTYGCLRDNGQASLSLSNQKVRSDKNAEISPFTKNQFSRLHLGLEKCFKRQNDRHFVAEKVYSLHESAKLQLGASTADSLLITFGSFFRLIFRLTFCLYKKLIFSAYFEATQMVHPPKRPGSHCLGDCGSLDPEKL